jgi:hypothetical protein
MLFTSSLAEFIRKGIEFDLVTGPVEVFSKEDFSSDRKKQENNV